MSRAFAPAEQTQDSPKHEVQSFAERLRLMHQQNPNRDRSIPHTRTTHDRK